MNKFTLCALNLALLLGAYSPAATAPTTAPDSALAPVAATQAAATQAAATQAAATQAAATQALAITAVAGTAVLGPKAIGTATAVGQAPAALTPGAPVSTTTVATIGGPVVTTVQPANGTAQPGGNASPAPRATPIPTLASGLGPTELKYHVLAAFPGFFYCDPDVYPVARGDEAALAQARFPAIQANTEEFQAILAHTNLAAVTVFDAGQKLLIYREHKKLAALQFALTDGKYQFQLQIKDSSGKGLLVTGLIDGSGAITAQQTQPAVVTCPI